MKPLIVRMNTVLLSFGMALSVGYTANVSASLNLADKPLFLGIQADPNIMFLLDDSGSMHWEFMPDELGYPVPYNPFVYPQPGNVYGGGDYRLSCGGSYTPRYFVPTFSDSNAYNLVLRSPDFNKTYYNPDINYEPWYNADGTQMNDADPRNAPYNPANPGLGDLDLRSSRTERAFWFSGSNADGGWNWSPSLDCNGMSHTYWPITYYLYDGTGDKNSISNYKKIQITSATGAGTTYTSPAGIKRTRDEEVQNFANWFTYYRSRLLASRGGIGTAFSEQGEDLRIGFGTINQSWSTVDGVGTNTIIRGVRSFTGSDRTDFYSLLYGRATPPSNTPLRKALNDAGQYFSRSDNRGPWSATPGTSNSTDHIECRKSYTILMTDGYWSYDSNPPDAYAASTSAARNNNDNANGSTHFNPDPDNYVERRDGTNYDGYEVENPFDDSFSSTLADVAMYYWKNDLRTDLANKIVVTEEGGDVREIANPAYWQHMITFGVGLGVTGNQDPDDAFQAVKDGTNIDWDNPFSTSPAKIDDLLHAAINSRGGFFSAGNPDEFANELTEILNQISSDEASSSSAVANTTRLDTDTLVYQAKFSPDNWSGQLLAYKVDVDDGTVDTDNPQWDADDKIPGHDQRNILTYRPGSGASAGGIDFEWANLTNAQKSALNQDIFGVVDNLGEQRLEYLRGDTSVTGPVASPFRSRTSESDSDSDGFDVLGDIVNSDPVYVRNSDFGYARQTSALSDDEKSEYAEFRLSDSYRNRRGMIYIGANDGMLHGFDAQSGRERVAYVPNALYSKLSALTSRDYTHQYYVDATPHVMDVHLNGSWKTVVTSTLGAGARAMFAIDVTSPSSINSSDVLWEIEADSSDADLKHMGYMLGRPQIVRTASSSDDWVVLVGNGYNSDDHQAVLLILDAEDGSVIKTINTGVGSAAEPNGLGTPLAADLNGDRIVDMVYAGDLYGNLWKFDLTSSNSSRWDIALKSGSTGVPLFEACESAGSGSCSAADRQPITVKPAISSHEDGYYILFGTGKYFTNDDAVVGASPRTESFYGIFDCGLDTSGSTCGSTVSKSDLIEQAIVYESNSGTPTKLDDDIRVNDDEPVAITNRVRGWYTDLKTPGQSDGAGERVVANPVIVSGALLYITFIPDSNPCNFGGSSWLMEVDPKTGGRFNYAKLDANNDGVIDENDYVIINSQRVYITGKRSDEKRAEPGILYNGTSIDKILSGSGGSIKIEKNVGFDQSGRQSWRELR